MVLLIIAPDTEISLSYDSQNTAETINLSSINPNAVNHCWTTVLQLLCRQLWANAAARIFPYPNPEKLMVATDHSLRFTIVMTLKHI